MLSFSLKFFDRKDFAKQSCIYLKVMIFSKKGKIAKKLTESRAPSKSVVTGSSSLFCLSFSNSGVKRSIDELVWMISRT